MPHPRGGPVPQAPWGLTLMEAALARLIDQIHTARAAKGRLRVAGGDTKLFYGQAPQGEPLDVKPLAGISAYEPSELVVTVRAGTLLSELEAALAEKNQHLAFEPPGFGAASTVGGMVAAGLSGPSRATAGGVRDHVLGVTLINGRGEVLSFGGQVMKNVAGYDVSRALAGSMGTLGVIAEVSLKVLPQPVLSATLRFEREQAAALAQMHAWGGQPLPITATAWWEGMLVVRLAGARAAVASAQQQLGGEVIAPELAATFWHGLRDHSDEYFVGAAKAAASDTGSVALWRLSVPQTAPALELPGEQLLEWGGAQRWLCTPAPPLQVRAAVQTVGGHATLFRARDKSVGVFHPLPGANMRIQRELQRAFDPDGVFDHGRLGL
jgi:glycolate oxidase FAD binding subunit